MDDVMKYQHQHVTAGATMLMFETLEMISLLLILQRKLQSVTKKLKNKETHN